MHSYINSSKRTKQKKINFYAFINTFFKNKNLKDKKNSCIQSCIFIQKVDKISCIRMCIFQKEQRIKSFIFNQELYACIIRKKKNQISCILIGIFQIEQNNKFIQISCILTCIIQKSNFMHL